MRIILPDGERPHKVRGFQYWLATSLSVGDGRFDWSLPGAPAARTRTIFIMRLILAHGERPHKGRGFQYWPGRQPI
jgi:hypothetical protein